MPTSAQLASVVDMNGIGGYVHWSIFTISEANLALIAAMVVIFGVALTIPFPGHKRDAAATLSNGNGNGATVRVPPASAAEIGLPEDATMWTARARRLALRFLPPGKLLPDRQPAYVASWIYVFGVATMVAFVLACGSGFAIALGGTDWWHTNPVGHFFNSMHLWSVELFMAFMVIHLWGKFWMAAWRGRRTMTWITGMVAFVASVLECFTGYLSQSNFDSQWISTSGKDAMNSIGVGAFFNLMNTGQMLLWHVVLIPVALVALIGAHVLLVRVRGVVHPLPAQRARGRAARADLRAADAGDWHGPTRRYDILKEATVAGLIATMLVLVLSAVLSSPDEPPVTMATWAKVAPADFLATASGELAGTTETAGYGQPYNSTPGAAQRLVISWQTLAGVRIPVNPANAFVLDPLTKFSATDPALAAALATYDAANAKTQTAWNTAYANAETKVVFVHDAPVIPAAADGPIPVLMDTELTLARTGGLETDLLDNHAFYGTNYTLPLLFLEDGQYFGNLAQAQHLTGTQWGVMNETGLYPGQPWLWLYTLWYQVPGFDHSANVDMIAIYMTGAATILLLAVPFIPGLRNVPEIVPLHRLVWRRFAPGAAGGAPPAGAAPIRLDGAGDHTPPPPGAEGGTGGPAPAGGVTPEPAGR